MMTFKISLRNIKKSVGDYMIYFLTLVLGVGIFYVFNSIGDQTVMMQLSEDKRELIQLMTDVLDIVSVFVSVVLGFLIVYASSFLMKRRKKEFGVYMILGMNKMKITAIMVVETVIIGIVSLLIGLFVGVVASQGMSIIIANLFEADMSHYKFSFSDSAVIKTLIYFAVMYLIVILLDVIVVGKSKLINLLNANKKSQKNFAKNLWICMIVFVASVAVLSSAYYNVVTDRDLVMNFTAVLKEIVKGMVSTLTLFWSLSGMMLFAVKRLKKFYYKGIRSFSVKELSSKINTTVLSGSIICILLFFTICILSSAISMSKSINDTLRENVPVDYQLRVDALTENDIEEGRTESETLDEFVARVDVKLDKLQDVVRTNLYYSGGKLDYLIDEKMKEELNEYHRYLFEHAEEEIIRLSEYNELARLYGKKEQTLEGNEYIVLADNDFVVGYRNDALKRGVILKILGKEYHPKYDKCLSDIVEMSGVKANSGIIIVPDDVDVSKLAGSREFLTANYLDSLSRKEKREIDDYLVSDEFEELVQGDFEDYRKIYFNNKQMLYDSSIGITALVVFVGLYLGITFLVSSAAILALKELSEAADNKPKYSMLRKLGVEEKMISRSLFGQSAVFFGAPLALAVIHSIFGLDVAKFLLGSLGAGVMAQSILPTALIIIGIYGAYFVVTYVCARRIISE